MSNPIFSTSFLYSISKSISKKYPKDTQLKLELLLSSLSLIELSLTNVGFLLSSINDFTSLFVKSCQKSDHGLKQDKKLPTVRPSSNIVFEPHHFVQNEKSLLFEVFF
ncbi:hypothetical protein GW796_08070 [archaeon]|nr:hypothetical protein [archaeon]